MNTPALRYLPIPPDVADEARRTLRDRFGHQLRVVKENGPCRVCLRIAPGLEDFILLAYRPLADTGPYAEIGPIFIHARECTPYAEVDTFPADFAARRLVLRAYDRNGNIAGATVAQPGHAPQIAADYLLDEAIAEVHVRHESYTCFDFKIVRRPNEALYDLR